MHSLILSNMLNHESNEFNITSSSQLAWEPRWVQMFVLYSVKKFI